MPRLRAGALRRASLQLSDDRLASRRDCGWDELLRVGTRPARRWSSAQRQLTVASRKPWTETWLTSQHPGEYRADPFACGTRCERQRQHRHQPVYDFLPDAFVYRFAEAA